MTRSQTHRWRAMSAAVLIVIAVAGTRCTHVGPLILPFTTIAALDSAGALDTVDTAHFGRVIGERELEIVGARPLPPNLGGPFQSPVPYAAPSRPTPGPTKKIDVMTDSEVVTYLNTLVYDMSLDHSELALLPCRKPGGVSCQNDSLAKVYIQPEVGMNRTPWGAVPPNGMVVARIINYTTSSDTESTIGFPPARRAWWYVDDSSGTYRSRFFVRTYAATGPAVTFLASRPWQRCSHPPVHNRPATARWRGCADNGGLARATPSSEAVDARAFIRALSFAPRRGADVGARPLIAAGSWITCSLGCCVGA